jgi:hypothetical protein
VTAFAELAKENNTMLIPANMGDPASMIAQVRGHAQPWFATSRVALKDYGNLFSTTVGGINLRQRV